MLLNAANTDSTFHFVDFDFVDVEAEPYCPGRNKLFTPEETVRFYAKTTINETLKGTNRLSNYDSLKVANAAGLRTYVLHIF